MISWVTSAFVHRRWRSAALGALSRLLSFVFLSLVFAGIIGVSIAAARFFDMDIQPLIRSMA